MTTAGTKREHSRGATAAKGRLCFLAIACLLTVALRSDAEAQTTTTAFDTPAASVKAGNAIDYAVSTNLSPLAARHAAIETTYRSGKAKCEAVANLNDRRGFRAVAEVKSPTNKDLAPIADAMVAMDFIAQDPAGRDRVKVDVEFAAIADAGAPLFESPGNPLDFPAGAYFEVEVGAFGAWGSIDKDQNGTEHVYMPTVRKPALLKVTGLHARNNGDVFPGFSELVIFGNGQEIERTNGRGTLKYKRKIVLDVPTNYVQLITIWASAFTNGLTYIDPVVTANAENPDVVVTLHGAVAPNPPPLDLFPPEELTAAGIDLAPLQEAGLLDPQHSISFVAPLPDTTYKVGAKIPTRFRLVDGDGAPIPDADAKDLVRACRVKVGLDAATRCVRYDAAKNVFRSVVRVPRRASVGMHQVLAKVLDDDGGVDESAARTITVRARHRVK